MSGKSTKKRIALVFMLAQSYQLVFPNVSFALMSGPSQPEVQSFEPVSTTQTVDPFTGDFTYNIPLLDVEGYPVNISYHSGYGMEDESSWVGLGWNINPGCVNRAVRGIPDDFKGESIYKTISTLPEQNIGVHTGVTFSPEVFGTQIKELSASVGTTLGFNFNNYRGFSASVDMDYSLKVPYASLGVGFGINSQQGADVNAGVSLTSSKNAQSQSNGSLSASAGTNFNTRTGLRNLTYGAYYTGNGTYGGAANKQSTQLYGSYLPIGLQNYVAVITNKVKASANSIQTKIGGEVYGGYMSFMLRADWSKMETESDGTKKAYGYLYSEAADDKSLMDFTRENDGAYNTNLSFLPTAAMTYDIYSFSGQGTGGMFRPFRNDYGSVHDPFLDNDDQEDKDISLEGGWGNLFEFGLDFTTTTIDLKSGPWAKMPFTGKVEKSLFENVYFKQAGELTKSNMNSEQQLAFSTHPVVVENDAFILTGKNRALLPQHTQKFNGAAVNWNTYVRNPRANHLKIFTNADASLTGIATNQDILNNYIGSSTQTIPRLQPDAVDQKKPYHIGEIVQTLPDGRRYVYGLPAMNNATQEVVFSTGEGNADYNTGIATYTSQDASPGNSKGRDHFYSSTLTPAYAHSYLLTGVLSDDYVDVLGDGITGDDLGSYTKFSYHRSNPDYRWKSPMVSTNFNSSSTDITAENNAQYNPGFTSDKGDDKAQFITGSKELWYLSAIEGRNQIAIFYTSKKDDAVGAKGPVPPYNTSLVTDINKRKTEKLDSIVLFNKNDYIFNGSAAVPLKTVIFQYDYQLCPGTPNSLAPAIGGVAGTAKGKLTLKGIYFRHGRSQKSLLSPYKFAYNSQEAAVNNNYAYSFASKNRWNGYKPQGGTMTNWEFPYVDQKDANNDLYASAWQLTKITLPSGGIMNIEYESDDYTSVQDRRAMQMVRVLGVGNTPAYEPTDKLYEDLGHQYQYVYFERNLCKEKSNLSAAENYLADQDYLYYSFFINLSDQRFEHIKGYAKVLEVGYCDPAVVCSGSNPPPAYGYVKVKLEKSGKKSKWDVNPITLTALNTGRYYIPHVLYPGYKQWDPDGSASELNGKEVMEAFAYSAGELKTIAKNPNVRFMEQLKARMFKAEKSFIRLQIPGLTKKGGGSRVKKITIDDSWHSMDGNAESSVYGQQFSYTVKDSKWGEISSGVASYEPFIGGDENPLKQPQPYVADGGHLLPKIEFFQEYPIAENLYPPAVGTN